MDKKEKVIKKRNKKREAQDSHTGYGSILVRDKRGLSVMLVESSYGELGGKDEK